MKFLWPTMTVFTLIPVAVSCVNKNINNNPNNSKTDTKKQYDFNTMSNQLVWSHIWSTKNEAVEKLDSQNIEFRKLAPHLYEIIDNFSYNQILITKKLAQPARFFTNDEMIINDKDTEFEKGLKTIYQNNKKFFEELSLNTHKYTEDNIRVKRVDKRKEENWDKWDYFYIDETTLNTEQKLYHKLYNILYNYDWNNLEYSEDSMNRLNQDKDFKKLIIATFKDYHNVNLPQGFTTRINDVRFSYKENGEFVLDFTQEIIYQGKKIPQYLTQYINIKFNTHLNYKTVNINNSLNKDLSNENYDFDYSYTEYKNNNIRDYKYRTYFIDDEKKTKIEPMEAPFTGEEYKYTIDFDEELEI
ncbi:hypothetical protein [Mycoplasmopsis iners]|uniref:hypothetical protein n=1 Tax=Mycoplasmopsis iners TaxID=76630 RepID=UPI0012ECB2AD|nr:hypothetical protein [Mycoplasmopsis iners]